MTFLSNIKTVIDLARKWKTDSDAATINFRYNRQKQTCSFRNISSLDECLFSILLYVRSVGYVCAMQTVADIQQWNKIIDPSQVPRLPSVQYPMCFHGLIATKMTTDCVFHKRHHQSKCWQVMQQNDIGWIPGWLLGRMNLSHGTHQGNRIMWVVLEKV